MLSILVLCLVVATNLLLAVIVLANNRRAALNRIFAALAFLVAAWAAITFLEDTGLSLATINRLAIADFSLAVMMVALFFWFCAALNNLKIAVVKLSVLAGVITNIILIASGQIVGVRLDQGNVILEPAWAFMIFLVFIIACFVTGLLLLARKYRRSVGPERQQVKFICFGLILTSTIMIITNLILPQFYNLSSATISRVGINSILIFSAFSAYAIIRHRFLDIRLIIARSVAYGLLVITLAGLYAGALFGVTVIFFPHRTSSNAQDAVYILLALILAFTFQPLRHFFERVTDNIFYRDRYDSSEVLNRIGKILSSELLLRSILEKSLQELCTKLRIQLGQFIIIEKGKIYEVSHLGPLPDKLITIRELAKLNRSIIIADELPSGNRKAILKRHGLRLSLALQSNDKLVGFLLLGDKLSGGSYTRQDLRVLEILASEIGVAIANAKAYEEISRFNATLQQKINAATIDLRTANANLKALDRAKDEFISIASHQLRTPLTSIKGYLSMIREGDVERLSIEQRQFLGFAYDGAERLVSLISDLLNVSRMSAGRFVLDRQPVDLALVVQDEIDRLKMHAASRGLSLVYKHPTKKMPLLYLDEGKTRQVIMNFIDNAIYYSPAGAIVITVQFDTRHVRLMVTDNGIGVPSAEQKKLFTKFYRAQNAQVRRPDGTGLGLYLAKKVIEDQGGKIIFESTEGKGSTFGFEFDLPPAAKSKRRSKPTIDSRLKPISQLTAADKPKVKISL